MFFFFNDPATSEIYTLSLHDALPISWPSTGGPAPSRRPRSCSTPRSEEHTSELQSRVDLVCRLLLEKKKSEMIETLLGSVSSGQVSMGANTNIGNALDLKVKSIAEAR